MITNDIQRNMSQVRDMAKNAAKSMAGKSVDHKNEKHFFGDVTTERMMNLYIKRTQEEIGHVTKENAKQGAGLIAFQFDPSQLTGHELREKRQEILDALDEKLGIDESESSKHKLYISNAMKLDEENAFCSVTYDGYENQDADKVRIALMSVIGEPFDSDINLSMNYDKEIPVTNDFVKKEASLEEGRLMIDQRLRNELISDVHNAHDMAVSSNRPARVTSLSHDDASHSGAAIAGSHTREVKIDESLAPRVSSGDNSMQME